MLPDLIRNMLHAERNRWLEIREFNAQEVANHQRQIADCTRFAEQAGSAVTDIESFLAAHDPTYTVPRSQAPQ